MRILKLAIIAIVVGAAAHSLHQARQQLGQYQWQVQPAWLVLAGLLYLLGMLPAALFWHRVLAVLGQHARLGETLRAYYVGSMGKYVPGKAMVVVLRTGLIRSQRVDTGVAAASVFVETLTMMAVGGFLAAAILAFWCHEQGQIVYGSLGLMVVFSLPTLPPVFRRLARLARVGRSDPAVAAKLEQLGLGTLLWGWAATALTWVVWGMSYWAVLRAMNIAGLDPIAHLPRYTAAVALAVVAGFLLLVLPGGVVGREWALVKVMTPYLAPLVPGAGLAAAWASAALLRLAWLLAEAAVSGILYLVGPRPRVPPACKDLPTET